MEDHNAGTGPSSPLDSDSISTSSASTSSSPTASSFTASNSSSTASNLSPPSCAPTPTLVSEVPETGSPSFSHSASAPPAKKKKSENVMAASMVSSLRSDWDPMRHSGTVTPASVAMSRIKKDLQEFHKHPPEGIYLLVRDENISCLDVLIVGPKDTPYQGGFFHFYLSFSDMYPFQPPRVKIMTTGGGTVRFNPNFYKNGKVCLSILGTWSGPQWNASQSLTSVLCSIQSLMTEEPYRNEPGHERIKNDEKKAVDYRFIIKHETLRVAVCDTAKGETTCPKPFIDRVVKPTFLKNYLSYLDGVSNVEERQPIDMFGENHGPFSFTKLEERLHGLKAELMAEPVDTAKTDEDFRVLGTSISTETENSSPTEDTTSKRTRTPWMMDYAQHSSEELEWDFDDIFDEDEEDEGEDDISDLSDFQEDHEGEGGGVTCDGHDIRQDNNNEGEDARVAGGKGGTESAGGTGSKKMVKERKGHEEATDAV